MINPGRDLDLNPKIVIEGEAFDVSLLMPSKSFQYSAKLMRMVGEPVAAMFSNGGDQESVAKSLPIMVKALTNNLDNPQALELVMTLMRTVSQNGKTIQFEQFFLGRMGLMAQVLLKIIEVQFKDFFLGLFKGVQELKLHEIGGQE